MYLKNAIRLALVSLSLAPVGVIQAQDSSAQAMATIVDKEGKTIGTATFGQAEKGVKVQVDLEDFESAAGSAHGLHLHQTGECKPSFKAAGGHFNPLNTGHGYLSPEGPHAGDMPDIWVEANGSASYSYTTNLITLNEGQRAILDDDGTALIIHSRRDDYLTNPSGNSGDRIACGAVKAKG